MNIYDANISSKRKNNYRRIYEQHHGPIPKDESGRSYEIHHIDGDHENNDILNLKLVTIEEHYKIHYSQGDYMAAWAILCRMNETGDLGRLSSMAQKKRVMDGTHHLLKKGVEHPSYKHEMYTFQNKTTNEIVESTMYDFQKAYNLDGSHLSLLISGRCRTIQGWRLLKISLTGEIWKSDDDHKMRDSKIYSFRNRKTGEVIKTTQHDLYSNHGANRRGVNAIVRGDSKFTGDWEIDISS